MPTILHSIKWKMDPHPVNIHQEKLSLRSENGNGPWFVTWKWPHEQLRPSGISKLHMRLPVRHGGWLLQSAWRLSVLTECLCVKHAGETRKYSDYIILHCDVMHDSRIEKRRQRLLKTWRTQLTWTIACGSKTRGRDEIALTWSVDLNEFIYWLIIYAMLGQCLFFYRVVSTPSYICWGTYYFTAELLIVENLCKKLFLIEKRVFAVITMFYIILHYHYM